MKVHVIRVALLMFAALALGSLTAFAHPGVGIVADKRGNVFYTDLEHVWRIEVKSGRKTIAVRDVHTHELSIDAAGNVYGEDNRYLGGERYRHRIWRRNADGSVIDVQPWREGFWREYGFVRDDAGATYWTRCPDRICSIRKRDASGKITTLVPGTRFGPRLNTLAAGPRGVVYVIDQGAIKKIERGVVTTFAGNVGESLMGMSVDAGGNVYVAAWGSRAIFRLTPGGKNSVVARSAAPWGPSGFTFAYGDLWILEYSTSNAVRVRRVRDGRTISVH